MKNLLPILFLPVVLGAQDFSADDTIFESRKNDATNNVVFKDGRYVQEAKQTITGGREFEVHEYLSQRGPGYVVVMTVSKGRQIFQKRENFGPENQKSHDWQEMEQ